MKPPIRHRSLAHDSLTFERGQGETLSFTTAHDSRTSRVELVIATEHDEDAIEAVTLNFDEIKELRDYLRSIEHQIVLRLDGEKMDKHFYER